MKKRFVLLAMVFSTALFAEEGMWLLTQLDRLDLNAKGLEISIEDIYHPDKPSLTDGMVTFGFCTASFVSPDGLILTNHHCSTTSLQRASKEGEDYLTDGFLARERSEEIPARGVIARVMLEMRDVTDEVLGAVEGIDDPVERQKAIDLKTREMSETIEAGREDIQARIVPMYKGNQYILFVYKKYQDVRIVFAPPASIGEFGGEIDNWMWPRHTGDFTYMRAYMAPDGTGAEYSEDNVPVRPKYYHRIALDDLDEGDFTFILGFPGGTNRWRTSNSVGWNLKYNYPDRIREFQELIDLMDAHTQDSEEGRIRVAAMKGNLANALKNSRGMVDGMVRTGFLEKKIAFEEELMQFIDGKRKLKKKYGGVLDEIKVQYAKLEETKATDDVLELFGFSAGTLAALAGQIVETAYERVKPENERDPGYSENDIRRAADRVHLRFFNYYEPVDRALLERALTKADALSGDSRVRGVEFALSQGIDAFVEAAYADTRLTDTEYAKSLFEKTPDELAALEEPLVTLALSLHEEKDEAEEQGRAFGAKVTDLRKQYLNALYAWKGEGLYPDANGTMRFCYGHVTGYAPRDAVEYTPFTTLAGVIEKDTGEEPFDVPEQLKQLYAEREFGRWIDPDLNDVPVNFLHRGDTTGGSSGSPVFNAKGEVIGLGFDGNYEAMTSDWQHDYEMQRDISVDIRYVMFITEKFAGAGYLLEEMGVN